MSYKNIITVIAITTILVSCKTTEQIQREKLVENVSTKVVRLQKENTDLSIAIQDLQEKMGRMQGQKNEKQYLKEQENQEVINKLKAEIQVLQENFIAIKDDNEINKTEIASQKKYIKQVLSTLGKLSGVKRKSKKTPFAQAIALYNAGKCKSAVAKLATQANNKKLSSKNKAKILHHLGVCEYKLKHYNKSIVSLSKVVTNYSKSYFVKNSLYYIGKNFLSQGQKDEAKQAFQEVIKRFPKSKQSGWAKSKIKGL